jgi:uncharacterized protein YjcR
MTKKKDKEEEDITKKKYCGAKKRDGTPCRARPMANGRCRLHGGKAGSRPGEGVRTGEDETIWFGLLSAEEKELYNKITVDSVSQINEELRLISIREFRMMNRYKKLLDQYKEFEDFIKTEKYTERGTMNGKPLDILREKEVLVLKELQNLDDAITRIQEKKQRLLELKHKVEVGNEDTEINIDLYMNALSEAAGNVWREDEDET